MAGSVNKVILVGNVGKDPEIRTTQDGRKIASMTVATSETWKDKNTGERKERTEWNKISIFNEGLVKITEQYVKKGTKLYLEGTLQTRKWQDNQGQDRYTTEIVLPAFGGALQLLSSADRVSEEREEPKAQAKSPAPEILDDEIPF
jgi:single-strand DNA-binding protein